MVPKHTYSWVMGFHPQAEVKGPLVSFPVVLSCYLSPSAVISHLVPPCLHLPSAPTPPSPPLILPPSRPPVLYPS